MRALRFFSLLLLFIPALIKAQVNSTDAGREKVISDFRLRNIDNKVVSLSSFKDAKGFIVIFTCNHCPFAKLYPQRFNELNQKYKSKGIPVIAVNPMDSSIYDDERFVMMQKKAATEKFTFPYLQDAEQRLAKNFGAIHTPQAFVIWKEHSQWVVKYSGAIDDNGKNPEKATSFVSKAVENLLQGVPVALPYTQSFGCKILYRN